MVKYIGEVDRQTVNNIYGNSRAGIVIYQPAANHYESQPIKMFEFMAAGLPVVASDFPLWKEIIESNNCGICVDPTDEDVVRKACLFFLENPNLAQKMGANGRQAVEANYSWFSEEAKLVDLYKTI